MSNSTTKGRELASRSTMADGLNLYEVYVVVIFDRGEIGIQAPDLLSAARMALTLAGGDESAVLEIRRDDYRTIGAKSS